MGVIARNKTLILKHSHRILTTQSLRVKTCSQSKKAKKVKETNQALKPVY